MIEALARRSGPRSLPMTQDITRLLADWDYEPGELHVRKIDGDDGEPKIQIRMDLGLMQLAWQGRPDGTRPHDTDSLLTYFRAQQAEHESESTEPYLMSREQCWALGQEALQYYWRRISFFELQEYAAAEADADHNLEILDICEHHAEHEEDRQLADQYRVFVTSHRVQARALSMLDKESHTDALVEIREGIETVEGLLRDLGDPEALDNSPELQYLRQWADEVEGTQPLTEVEQLRVDLKQAVEQEQFERAASLRDELKEFDNQDQGTKN